MVPLARVGVSFSSLGPVENMHEVRQFERKPLKTIGCNELSFRHPDERGPAPVRL
jgi:hypothetical protein